MIQKSDINIDYYISNKIKIQDFYFQDILALWNKFKNTLLYLLCYSIVLFIPSMITAITLLTISKDNIILFIIGIVMLLIALFSALSIIYAYAYIKHSNSFIRIFEDWQVSNNRFDDANLLENFLEPDALEKYHQISVCSGRHKFIVVDNNTLNQIQNQEQPVKISIVNKLWFKSTKPTKVKDKKIYAYSFMVLANAHNLYIDGYKANINMFAYDYLKFVLEKDIKLSPTKTNNHLEIPDTDF
ncbi:MAG0920 family protein [Mycoplasma sp. BRA285]